MSSLIASIFSATSASVAYVLSRSAIWLFKSAIFFSFSATLFSKSDRLVESAVKPVVKPSISPASSVSFARSFSARSLRVVDKLVTVVFSAAMSVALVAMPAVLFCTLVINCATCACRTVIAPFSPVRASSTSILVSSAVSALASLVRLLLMVSMVVLMAAMSVSLELIKPFSVSTAAFSLASVA